MASKSATVKSAVLRVQPLQNAASELAVVSAYTPIAIAPARSEATPLKSTAGRVKSREQPVHKSAEMLGTSMAAKHRLDAFVPHAAPVLESIFRQSPLL